MEAGNSMKRVTTFVRLASLALLFLFTSRLHAEFIFTNFSTLDTSNENSLIQDADGNFYGTAQNQIFQVTPDGVKTFLAGPSNMNDGSNLFGAVLRGMDGYLYGTSQSGGTNGGGTVFRVGTNGSFTAICSFSMTNGSGPLSLVQAKDGSLYGVTFSGGNSGDGTVFKLTTNGFLTTLATFIGTNGAQPSSLIFGNDGNLYGVTHSGGINSLGTAFKVMINGTTPTLISFPFPNNGYLPSTLIQGNDGYLYGLSEGISYFAVQSYAGAMFRMTTNGNITLLAGLSHTNLIFPDPGYNSLIQASDGNFYGLTFGGYPTDKGSLFQVTPSGTVTTLVSFTGTNGAFPSSLIQAADGNLYGLTQRGVSSNNFGALFRLSLPKEPVLKNLTPTNGTITLTWNAFLNKKYQAQYSSDMNPTNWHDLTDPITATNAMISTTDSADPQTSRFYRVVLLP